MKVALRENSTGKVCHIKVGWSWPCMLLGQFAIPLFLKGLYGWGSFLAILTLIKFFTRHLDVMFHLPGGIVIENPTVFADFIQAVTLIFVGAKANEFQAIKYLRSGWDFCSQTSIEVSEAKKKWRIEK